MHTWIDTHMHLLYPDRLHYDWMAGSLVLNREFPLEEYLALAKSLSINSSLYMEADVRPEEIEQEMQWAQDLAENSDGQIVGAISACRPETEDAEVFSHFVDSAIHNPLICGFRRVLHVIPDHLATHTTFQDNVNALSKRGHPFELCIFPRQYPQIQALLRACPNTVFVLDHCGNPDIASHMATDGLIQWQENIRVLAAYDNVYCKISGITTRADFSRWDGDGQAQQERIAADLRPYVEHVIAVFGWQRVVWGSDFPVCNLACGLADWKAVTDRLLMGVSESELDQLSYKNACNVYHLHTARA